MTELTEPLDPSLLRLRDEQLRRWEAGERVSLESLLAEEPGLAEQDDLLLDLIYGEVLLREDFGEQPRLAEYERRFPQLAGALRRQFELHQLLATPPGGIETLPPSNQAAPESDSPSSTQIDLSPRRTAVSRPERIGTYDVLEEIGRGGMGIVYKGRHRLLPDRLAALKVIRPSSDADLEDLKVRFLREAAVFAHLEHPNIVRMHEAMLVDVDGQQVPVVALEYVEGGSLASALNGTPLPAKDSATLLRSLADAIAYAHSRGVLHRDLKPANILLQNPKSEIRNPNEDQSQPHGAGTGSVPVSDFGFRISDLTPKVTDFGLAKRLDLDSSQTRTGAVIGTPSYMPPEQARAENSHIEARSDVYSLGAILYECLTGRPPFKGESVLQTLQQVTTLEPVAPHSLNPSVPRDLETICLKCLEKETGRRYDSARALCDELQRFLDDEPITARPAGVIERTARWARRRPASAGLIAVSVLAAIACLGLWVFFTVELKREKEHAQEQEKQAKIERDEVKRQKAIADSERDRAAHLLALAASSVEEIALSGRAAKLEEIETRNTGWVLFKMACNYAKTAAVLRNKGDLWLEDRTTLSEQYAVSAVRLLRCAEQAKFFESHKTANREALAKDPDLDVLRNRLDFKSFVASLR